MDAETSFRMDVMQAIGEDLLLAHGEVDHSSTQAIRERMELIWTCAEAALAGKTVVIRRLP